MMAAGAATAIGAGLSRARRTKDRAFTAALWTCGVLAMLPLLFIAGYVVAKGITALSVDFFTKEPTAPGLPGGGIVQSFIGTGIIMGMAVAFSVPLGVLTGVYLAEYGTARAASVIRFIAEVLLLVPDEYREGALALGIPRWRTILRVVVPTAGAGIFTAIMLALARGLGETAPVLLTALGNNFVNVHPTQPMDAVPLRIYNYARTPVEQQHALAWGGAIVLLVVVLGLSITARFLSNRQKARIR